MQGGETLRNHRQSRAIVCAWSTRSSLPDANQAGTVRQIRCKLAITYEERATCSRKSRSGIGNLRRLRVSEPQMRSGIAILCALLAVYVLVWEASAERAKRKGAVTVTLYRATIGFRVLLGAGTLVMVYGAGAVDRSDNFRRDWWVSVLSFGLAVFCASQWPADLGVSESGI
jgi:hypothetical protein